MIDKRPTRPAGQAPKKPSKPGTISEVLAEAADRIDCNSGDFGPRHMADLLRQLAQEAAHLK